MKEPCKTAERNANDYDDDNNHLRKFSQKFRCEDIIMKNGSYKTTERPEHFGKVKFK